MLLELRIGKIYYYGRTDSFCHFLFVMQCMLRLMHCTDLYICSLIYISLFY